MAINSSNSGSKLIGWIQYNTSTINNMTISGFMITSNSSYCRYGTVTGMTLNVIFSIINTTS